MVFGGKQKGGFIVGVRARKSFKAGPARMTFSKSGVSTSVGVKGVRVGKMANGKTRTTLSVPGTGISYVSESGKADGFDDVEAQPSGDGLWLDIFMGILLVVLSVQLLILSIFWVWFLVGCAGCAFFAVKLFKSAKRKIAARREAKRECSTTN